MSRGARGGNGPVSASQSPKAALKATFPCAAFLLHWGKMRAMASCVECGTENDLQARFCSSCGQPTASVSEFATVAAPNRRAVVPVRQEEPKQATVSRFAPGTVLDTRYRIIALLGKGGMGEVYRADDLKLGHAVALKFLPPSLEHDIGLLDRFHAEVRNARQISHPYVCRVYDIGET